ncbi:MAG: MBL fold metallo-hydrolase [Aggregatilineales bacterium]
MLLKYIYDDRLAQASYFLGCPGNRTALVIDPARDIAPYLRLAEQNGMTITHVAETHIHADYVSGGRELASKTGATLYVSGEGQGDLAYDINTSDGVSVHLLNDGDTFMVGGVKIEAIHTPGHTPEHMSYMVTDTGADQPIGLFSGDFIFAGDVGRPDLLDATGMQIGSREAGAKQQFQSIEAFKQLPDYLQIWPGHGAGSACGKALGAIPSTTLGYEKIFNPAFQHNDEASFVTWMLDGQPEVPRYFAQMKRVNRTGANLLSTLPEIPQLSADAMDDALENGLVIDARDSADFAEKNVRGTLNIPVSSNSFNTWAGWYVDFINRPVYLIVAEDQREDAITALREIGVDNIGGIFSPQVALAHANDQIKQIDAKDVQGLDNHVILDVRGRGERAEKHIPDSLFVPMGDVPEHADELPRDKNLIVQCGGGVRSQIVVSLLRQYGIEALNLTGGIDAWEKADLPLVRE